MKRAFIILALAATVAVPFLLRPGRPAPTPADVTLVIITPHNEAIRRELGAGFERSYRRQTGRNVVVDWRVIGGTSEITRYLEGEYTAAFANHWKNALRRPWSTGVEAAFQNPDIVPDASPEDDTPPEAARRAFLASEVGCGIDVFFGGGTYDFIRQARAGRIVDSGILRRHPELFADTVVPRFYAGQEYWDPQGRWIGSVLSNYGILFNRESLARLGITEPPRQWEDLKNPRLLGEVALADPTKSGSVAEAFENIIQQQMQRRLLEMKIAAPSISALDEKATEAQAVREGWIEGLRLIQLIGANARYFTDASQKVPIDVATGNCAAGLCIDFYGRQQEEAVRRRGGSDRLEFVSPAGGTMASVDPIALLRGAKNREVAIQFIEWVLSMEGQQLWNLRPGTPGGPVRSALRRLPVRRDFYGREDLKAFRSDPEVSPFDQEDPLIYQAAWTGEHVRSMAFIIRIICLDTHPELVAAWRAIIKAGQPAEALAVLQNLSNVSYDKAAGEIRAALRSRNKVDEIALAKRLGGLFRAQYRRAAEIARKSRSP